MCYEDGASMVNASSWKSLVQERLPRHERESP